MDNNAKSQRGSTLTSVLISAGMISAIVVGAYSSLDRVKEAQEFNSTSSSLCRLAAKNILSSIRSSGGATKVYKTPITSGSVSLANRTWHSGRASYNRGGVDNEYGVSEELNDVRWPNQRVVNFRTGLPGVSHAPKAIYSYMNSLASVLYSNNSVCSSLRGLPLEDVGVENWGPGADLENYQAQSSIRIRPYNINTGAYDCGVGPNRWPRPYGVVEPPLGVQDGIVNLSNYDPSIGFEVEARVRLNRPQARRLASVAVDDDDGGGGSAVSEEIYECSVTEKFSYDVQSEPVPAPSVERVGTNLRVSIPTNRYSLGSYLLCRSDFYIIPALSRGSPIARRSRNIRGPGEGWRPCDMVTNICGQNLGPADVNNLHTSVEIDAPTRANCAYEYEAVTVDAAGNVSLIASVSGFEGGTNPVGPRSSDRDGSSGPAYSVDGVNYATAAAAQVAADLSGLPMQPIASPPTNPMDAQFNSMNSARSSAFDSYNAATASRNTAAAAAASATSLNSGMTSANTSSSLGAAAASAAASASTARSAATSARSAANAAAASAAATATAAASFSGPGQPGAATAAQSVKEAQAAADWAAEAAAEAEAAALAAEQAARELAEKEREAAEREARDDDDDD